MTRKLFYLHARLWARWGSEVADGWVTPDGTRTILMATLSFCFHSEIDEVESQAKS